MSSGLQNKMYNFEVPPPPGVWEKIAAELDESELDSKFPSRLYDAAVVPPPLAWQRIAAALEESSFVNDYAAKLAGAEVVPPAAVWNKIKTSLDTANDAPRKIPAFIKFAAAAVVLAFLAWGGSQLLNNNKKTDTHIADNGTAPAKDNSKTTINPSLFLQYENIGITGADASLEEARNDAALEASKKNICQA